jgi:hypothetical protein
MYLVEVPESEALHVGRSGLFVPIGSGQKGGQLLRIKDEKEYAVAGTKGYLWAEADSIKTLAPDLIDGWCSSVWGMPWKVLARREEAEVMTDQTPSDEDKPEDNNGDEYQRRLEFEEEQDRADYGK